MSATTDTFTRIFSLICQPEDPGISWTRL